MSTYDDVYGVTYQDSIEQMSILKNSIEGMQGKGFVSAKACAEWAKENLLDKVVFSNMNHAFYYVSHKGEILNSKAFVAYYGNILYFKAGEKVVRWIPDDFKYLSNAYIVGEKTDGLHKPLYHRNYFEPTGCYDYGSNSFNIAKTYPVFAKETGRDTTHIYMYIQHIAQECAMWLLAWLRAKLLNPTQKTQVVPVIVSRAQGSGKSTFGEVICKGLFGNENVLVTDQYDSQARFNADYADALIVCQEEKEETDRKNPASAIKSRATAATIRKELKGVDPIYQESYTDFVITTNKDVPIKFDGREDQRRFMVMNADEHFTRKESKLADEVFSKLYGIDGNLNKVGVPFVEDHELIAQFKHELYSREDIAKVQLRNFPHTAAYNKCFTLPRTNEATDIESIIFGLAPFIKASLEASKIVEEVDGNELKDIALPSAFEFIPAFMGKPAMVAICRPVVFCDMSNGRAFQHSTVERGLYAISQLLRENYGIELLNDMTPLPGGFRFVKGRYRLAPAARFVIPSIKTEVDPLEPLMPFDYATKIERRGERLRVNDRFKKDSKGCFETVNEMPENMQDLSEKTKHVLYMDTFLLEADYAPPAIRKQEEGIIKKHVEKYSENQAINAEELYAKRLRIQLDEGTTLFNKGIVCRIVYSGAKSMHFLVRVADAPKTLEEYRWLHSYLCSILSEILEFDPMTADPARLTRSPLTLARTTEAYGLTVKGVQKLIKEDFSHIYQVHWRRLFEAWQVRPFERYENKNKRMMPTKKKYIDAVEALLDGSFWIDSSWNGQRQEVFFTAYRLLRLLGFEHADLWDNILLKNIDGYYHTNEINYWKSREKCSLIDVIDDDVDSMQEE